MKKRLLHWPIFLLCAGALLLCFGCGKTPETDLPVTPSVPPVVTAPESPAASEGELHSAVNFFLDTVVTISSHETDSATLNDLLSRCAEYEALLSKTIEGSDVWRINHAEGEPVTVSGHTIAILEKALEISALSEGAFDVTIAPASELWDFKTEPPILPSKEALAAAAALVNYTKIQISGDTVTLPAGMMIDLGAIAKGYIAEEIARLCKERGITSGMLNFGGNVIVLGAKPDGSPWKVGIQDPQQSTGGYLGVMNAIDRTVVTSGIYERGFDLGDIRYHHLLDTDTGWPIQNELASVTIITDSSMEADALSTACFALGTERAKELLTHFPGAGAIFITRGNEVTATEDIADSLVLVQ